MNRDLVQCSHGVFYSDRIDQTKKTPFWDRPPPFLRVWMTAPPSPPPPLIWRYGFATAIKEALKSFFLPFQMYCSCINYIHVLSFSQLTLENVYKISENVSFCYCTEITIALPKKSYMRSIRSSGVGYCLLRAQGWGRYHQKRKKNANSRGIYREGISRGEGNGLN